MAGVRRVGDLEIAQDLAFQDREWVVQRVAWAAMILVLVVALVGLLGNGPLSNAVAQEGSLGLEYQRFERKHAPTELAVKLAAGAAAQGQVELWLARDFVRGVEVQAIAPEPDQVAADGDRMVYTFQVKDPGQPTTVVLELEHDDWGVKTGRAGVVDGPSVEFRQVVYP